MADADDTTLNEDDLAAYLTGVIDGFEGLTRIVKFQSGQSNPTYRLDAESGTYVLRAKPPGKLLPSAHQVDREFKVMQALAGTCVPVPAMLHLASDGDSPIGRAFFVMQHVEGRIFWDPALPQLDDPVERGAVFDAMNRTLAAIHSVDLEAVGLADFGRPGNYFSRQLSRWSEQWRQSKIDDIAAMEQLIAWLEDNLPADDGAVALVHGDYRLDNLIFAADQPKLLAVLDWELSTLGHPIADLAYQCMQWRLPNSGAFKGLGGIDRAEQGLPSEAQYIAAYCDRRGLRGIDDWTFYLAFSFFRLAAILQGVFKRYADGNASNPQKAQIYGRNVPALSKLALEAIENG
ncbi:phosphotransferase family protein [Jiella sp. MQZ9-1]|uniref:Phosphotransferase family protein n=1 Tax=Jiella flava TaxID=2816857 RepID=A0A939FYY2_9HYPH|nr:phosphotransferase family protein [Jiella flava]MBO0662072.1 phosphotransferase family protein [Jiella flava]MCD2470600.1 phosphotransferase family protein [Jiella flava]